MCPYYENAEDDYQGYNHGYTYRESGRYGSSPLYDRYDEDSYGDDDD